MFVMFYIVDDKNEFNWMQINAILNLVADVDINGDGVKMVPKPVW